jgi:hypothetical protein
MITFKTKLAVVAASALALATAAQAQPSVSISGFAQASYQKISNGAGADRFDLDAALLKFTGDAKPVTGVVSLYHTEAVPGLSAVGPTISSFDILDAYATYTSGEWAITAGRFLSFLGYESFFSVNNPEITGANAVAIIPGYLDGIKAVYTDKDWNAGVSLVDSTFNVSPLKGDGEFARNYGAEVYFAYTGITDTTIFAAIAYDSKNGAVNSRETFDLWAQYQVDKDLYVAAEVAYADAAGQGFTYLVLANYTFNPEVSLAFRVSGDEICKGTDDIKLTVAPTYTFTKNLSVRAEVSYTNFSGGLVKDIPVFAVQGILKF